MMWEAIRSNRRRSALMLAVMAGLLAGLGALIGAAAAPRAGLPIGLLVAGGVFLVLWLTATSQGRDILLRSAGAIPIDRQNAPRLCNIVEEMAIASGLPKPPSVHIIEDDSLNAFAVGRAPGEASVAVTSGLASKLGRDELQGVMAHEISHIANEDTRFMTMAAVMVGSIVMISDLFFRNLRFGGMRRRTGRDAGSGQIVFVVLAVAGALLAPLFAQLLYFACSRRREFLADASAARFTRYPEGLASALEKITSQLAPRPAVNRTLAPLYIVNPLQAFSDGGLFSTHPPTAQRIHILRAMAGGAGYSDYEAAFRKVTGEAQGCLGPSALSGANEGAHIAARAPSLAAEDKPDAIARVREVADLLSGLGGYLIVPCACGVRIKLPPGSNQDSVRCPRCGRVNAAPRAEGPPAHDQASAAIPLASRAERAPSATQAPSAPPPVGSSSLRYARRGAEWESFRCACGGVVQISPSFVASFITCRSCGRRIDIQPPQAEAQAGTTRPLSG